MKAIICNCQSQVKRSGGLGVYGVWIRDHCQILVFDFRKDEKRER